MRKQHPPSHSIVNRPAKSCPKPVLHALMAASVAAVILSACAVEQPRVPARFDGGPYRRFLTPRPLLPFLAEGSVLLRFRGDRESGGMNLQATEEGGVRLQLLARITGSLIMELRFDRTQLLVVDYVHKTYYRGPNTPEVRLRLFDVDLDPLEFLILLTGRVPEPLFAAGNGTAPPAPLNPAMTYLGSTPPPGAKRIAQFHAGQALYRFWLNGEGLPERWLKLEGGKTVFRAEYLEYAEVPVESGPPLRLPRKIRLYLDGGPPTMVLGIRSFAPGEGEQPAVSFSPLPRGARDFAPTALPERPSASNAR